MQCIIMEKHSNQITTPLLLVSLSYPIDCGFCTLYGAKSFINSSEVYCYGKCSKTSNTKKIIIFPLFVILEITFQKKC